MLSIILPAYNEKQNIERTAKTLSGILEKEGIPFELLFISDGSGISGRRRQSSQGWNWRWGMAVL